MITIYKGTMQNAKILYSKSKFFKDRVIIKSDYERMEINLATIDYEGKTLKVIHRNDSSVQISFNGDCPMGKNFKFDPDESTEDKAVIYFDR